MLAEQELSFLEIEQLLFFHRVICLPDCCLDLQSFLPLISQLKGGGRVKAMLLALTRVGT